MDVSNLHIFMSFILAQKNVFNFFFYVDFHIIYILLHTFYIEYNNDTFYFQTTSNISVYEKFLKYVPLQSLFEEI